MSNIPAFSSEEEERKYWEHESVADHLDELEEVEVKVKEPLSHTLSVRVSKEDLRKLRELAKESGIGTTTMARFLLKQALKKPDGQLAWLALQDESLWAEFENMWEEGKIPADSQAPVMYFFSGDRLREMAELMQGAASRVLKGFLKEIGQITPADDAFRSLKEKELETSGRR